YITTSLLRRHSSITCAPSAFDGRTQPSRSVIAHGRKRRWRASLGRSAARKKARMRFVVSLLAWFALVPAIAGAQAPGTPPKTGVIQGVVTTQGTVRLPGADVVVKN